MKIPRGDILKILEAYMTIVERGKGFGECTFSMQDNQLHNVRVSLSTFYRNSKEITNEMGLKNSVLVDSNDLLKAFDLLFFNDIKIVSDALNIIRECDDIYKKDKEQTMIFIEEIKNVVKRSDSIQKKLITSALGDVEGRAIEYLTWLNSYEKRRRSIGDEMRQYILKKFDYKCAECGSREDLEVDHVHEVFDGGESKEENLQALCHKCHLKKTLLSKFKRNHGSETFDKVD
jgi:5-methylcytosine-specific restriction endonuclease McrA